MPDATKLVIGYGNPCRGDDGLGTACAQAIEALRVPGVTVDSDAQLSVEHATLVATHHVVVFVDADPHVAAPFTFREVAPSPATGLTTHSVSPGALLDLAATCFQAKPRAFVLGIRASAMEDFHEGLSHDAAECLERAVTFLHGWLRGDGGHALVNGKRRPVMRDGTHVILCIDDDEDILASLRVVLESAGYSVETATSASRGLDAWSQHAPDLLIVDLMMEHVDSGLTLVRDLRDRGCAAPVYFLSSTGDYLNATTDMSAMGVSGVFQKPLNPVLLLGLLRSRLAAGPAVAAR